LDIILALERAIDDPATPADKREEHREDLGGVTMGHLDIRTPEEEREYCATIDPRDLLTDAEFDEFINAVEKPERQAASRGGIVRL
jgi:hypothetical protein